MCSASDTQVIMRSNWGSGVVYETVIKRDLRTHKEESHTIATSAPSRTNEGALILGIYWELVNAVVDFAIKALAFSRTRDAWTRKI